MIINVNDLLTLSDAHSYIVSSKIRYENIDYYYLVDKDDYSNVKFCYEDKGDLVELDDKLFIMKLLPLFLENIK